MSEPTSTPNPADETVEQAEKYYRDLPPHVKMREGGKVIRGLLDALSLERAKRAKAVAERERFYSTCGVIELMVRNPNVDSHVREWEKRALEAEAELAEVKADKDRLSEKVVILGGMAHPSTSALSWGIEKVMADNDRLRQEVARCEERRKTEFRHLEDVYASLGIKWGDDPFHAIDKLKAELSTLRLEVGRLREALQYLIHDRVPSGLHVSEVCSKSAFERVEQALTTPSTNLWEAVLALEKAALVYQELDFHRCKELNDALEAFRKARG